MDSFKAITTTRLLLKVPARSDAEAIFQTYAQDPEVTKYVGWPRHKSIEDTNAFIEFALSEWKSNSVGPYLIYDLSHGRLLGSTGISLTGQGQAMTGYVIAKEYWGNGYATEALEAMIRVARELKLGTLFALCHPAHLGSRRVLEKAGFGLDASWLDTVAFPNIEGANSVVPLCYRLQFVE